MLNSISELNPNLSIREISDYTDISVYPEYEKFLIDDYDKQFEQDTFIEYQNRIFENPNWDNTKLYYMIQGYLTYLKDILGIELNQIFDFQDPYFLKTYSGTEVQNVYELIYIESQSWEINDEITLIRSGNQIIVKVFEILNDKNYVVLITENNNNVSPINTWRDDNNYRATIENSLQYQNIYNNYYERFFELFTSYVSFLQPYLDLFEGNEDIINVNKKDLLIYFGKKIYEYRGTSKGFSYIKNIFNPMYYLNKLTGEIESIAIDIDIQEYGKIDSTYWDIDKLPYVYNLVLSNISNVDLKISLLNIIEKLIHPAGYKANVSDYIQFLASIKLNTILYNTIDKSVKHSFYLGNDIESVSTGDLEAIKYNSPKDYVDYVHMKTYTVNDGQVDIDLTYG
jgi:hypothetical protein